jgi:hypothetical protein
MMMDGRRPVLEVILPQDLEDDPFHVVHGDRDFEVNRPGRVIEPFEMAL